MVFECIAFLVEFLADLIFEAACYGLVHLAKAVQEALR